MLQYSLVGTKGKVHYRGGNNFIRFKFTHFAIFARLSTKFSDLVALKLPVLTLKISYQASFLIGHQKALSSVLTKKKNFPNGYRSFSTLFSFFLENTL